MSKTLLMHIAYYMNPNKRLDNKNGIDKTSKEFTEHVLSGVLKFLKEINEYNGFSKKDVVLDVNVENEDISKIDESNYPDINLIINKHEFKDEHPYRLTTKHRLSMLNKINDYDWFGYSEDDTIIYKETIDFLLKKSVTLFETEKKVYTIPRLVYNLNNEYFFSDIKDPSKLIKTVNGNAIEPTNRFGACWFYPKEIMNEWLKCNSFLNFDYPNSNGGIRVRMGWGIAEIKAIVPINSKNEPEIKCVHLGYCGKYYFPHPNGFHKLPIDKICK
tara:strand:- start:1825 stop:2643 length:819 start_codon:yes stop_codon:yes gene_type:complete